jgi:hypothetical protein
MMTLKEEDKLRVLSFLEDNELDYTPIDNGIIRFHLIAEDGMTFYIINNENEYLITKYDSNKDRPGSVPYENYQFKTLSEVLEQLKFYDTSLPKIYWQPILETIEIGFDKDNHIDNWYEPFIKDDFYKVEEDNQYKYFSYTNEGYKPELISPFNTLHQVSAFNDLQLEKVEKLYLIRGQISSNIFILKVVRTFFSKDSKSRVTRSKKIKKTKLVHKQFQKGQSLKKAE